MNAIIYRDVELVSYSTEQKQAIRDDMLYVIQGIHVFIHMRNNI